MIYFRGGLIPFRTLTRYVLLSRDDEFPFQWLQSVEVPHLAMVTVPLALAFPEFQPKLSEQAAAWLELREGQEPTWLAIVVLAPSLQEMTANLLAPLAINFEAQRGEQVVQELDTHWARVPLSQSRLADAA